MSDETRRLAEGLDALFERGETGEEDSWAGRVGQDDAARGRYDVLALASRELEQTAPADRSDFERAFGEASFLGALDAMLEEERAAEALNEADPSREGAPVISWPRRRRRAAGLAAAAALAAGFIATLSPERPPALRGELQPRSAHPLAARPGRPQAPELALFCVTRAGDQVTFTGEEDAPFGLLACPVDGQLKIAHRGASAPLSHVAVFGVHQDGEVMWYGPSPAAPAPVRLAGRAVDGLFPVGESIRLEVNHTPGVVRVHAIFASRPLNHDKLERLVRAQPRRERFERAVLRLDDEAMVSSSKTFDVMEAER